jgi:hypothetical protein
LTKARQEKKAAAKRLREAKDAKGLKNHRESIPNRKCQHKTIDDEQTEREEVVTAQLRIMRKFLPGLLKQLARIEDPRNPRKIKHKMTLLMTYGILAFVFQMASRRKANQYMTRPQFMANLKLYFPEIDDLPHGDTLERLLSRIEKAEEIEFAHIKLIQKFIRNKKFLRYLIDKCYPLAVDGTQKFKRDELWSEQCQERTVRKGDETQKQYYVYILEASLAFSNGMTIPFMSEFLDYTEGDTDSDKQDCETKAFKRLATRIKAEFPKLPFMILVDGLYPNGPIMELCLKNKWQFMIVLKDKSLPSVWKEYEVLKALEKNNTKKMNWGERRQRFHWVNNIEYWHGPNDKKRLVFHVVVCEEAWEEISKNSASIESKNSRHVWISSKALSNSNVHERCNLGARHRWGIELEILVEKRHGYNYEHCFSYNWTAMKGYHYLMRIGLLFNILAQYSECLIEKIKSLGKRSFVEFVRETIAAPWLDAARIKKRLEGNFQLRFI